MLVANAGGPPPGRALDLDDSAIASAINANMLTSIRLVRAAVPYMRSAGWGRICLITSHSIKIFPAFRLRKRFGSERGA